MAAETMICVTNSAAQTKKLGKLLAKAVLESGRGKHSRILALRGGLGAGKTNFIQGFANGLGVKNKISSPTFIIWRRYPLASGGFKNFYHVDLYRLEDAKDLRQLGVDKIFGDPANVVAVEWPDIAPSALPGNAPSVELEIIGKNKRRITIKSEARISKPETNPKLRMTKTKP